MIVVRWVGMRGWLLCVGGGEGWGGGGREKSLYADDVLLFVTRPMSLFLRLSTFSNYRAHSG